MANHLANLAKLGRFVVAVIAGTILGNAFAVVAALGIDASYGLEVTGGAWQLTTPNIIYAAITGFLVGLFAGSIAKTRGWLVGAVSQFFLLALMVAVSIYLNRDLMSNYQVKPAVWTWIGLLPAIIGGHLGEWLINDKETIHLLKSIEWHWAWVWIVVLFSIYSIAGSIRFLIIDSVLAWQIIFIPSLWFVAFLFFPVVSALLFASFSIPAFGTIALITLLASHHNEVGENRPSFLKPISIALGIPISLFVVWYHYCPVNFSERCDN